MWKLTVSTPAGRRSISGLLGYGKSLEWVKLLCVKCQHLLGWSLCLPSTCPSVNLLWHNCGISIIVVKHLKTNLSSFFFKMCLIVFILQGGVQSCATRLKSHCRAGKVSQWQKCLLCKYRVLNSDPQHLGNKYPVIQSMSVIPGLGRQRQADSGGSLGYHHGELQGQWETLAQNKNKQNNKERCLPSTYAWTDEFIWDYSHLLYNRWVHLSAVQLAIYHDLKK